MISAGFGVLNALACVLLAVLLLPMAETFTGIETDLTLLEWSDLNRPLMQRLSLEAPGTYAHTIAIANLAEAACRAIGANALLARVGAYYHDIGKIAKPQYFVENQAKGRNPHDALASRRERTDHSRPRRGGLELAGAAATPARVAGVHHRASRHRHDLLLPRQGAARARTRVGNADDFAYPGPLPQSAETAVVMLADGIEAATRVLARSDAARRSATSSSTSSGSASSRDSCATRRSPCARSR